MSKVTLNVDQLRELKWFCQNVVGTRQEFYILLDGFMAYKSKIDRLYETVKVYQKFMRKLGQDDTVEPFKSLFDDINTIDTTTKGSDE